MTTPAKIEFGSIFRLRRETLGLNLSEFCRQNGFDKGNVSRIERGVKPPPKSAELLQAFADALLFEPDSGDWKVFMRAALNHDRAVAPELEGRLAHSPRRAWVEARHLEQWSSSREAQGELPNLVRQLIIASPAKTHRIEIPSGEGVQRHGWDGLVESESGSHFVPTGASAWEISVEQNPKQKADRDFKNRTTGPLGLPASEVTFVFVTSRKWDKKQAWRDEKREVGRWKSVEVFDSSDLEAWLESAAGVDAWLAAKFGLLPDGVISIDEHWKSLARLTVPNLGPNVFLASRKKSVDKVVEFFNSPPGVLAIECRSPSEGIDFVAALLQGSSDATIATEELERLRSRTLLVGDHKQWRALSRVNQALNLVISPSLAPSAEELSAAVQRGHRVLMAATHYSNHSFNPVSLERPFRYDLEKSLEASGFVREKASKAARAAGGSVSVLKRHLSTVPLSTLPAWSSGSQLRQGFLPLLLAGGWDDANPHDRELLSQLANLPYSEIRNVASQLLRKQDSPLTCNESRWRLVSPEDSWTLVGNCVHEELLNVFESVALKILGQENTALKLTPDERFKRSIRSSGPQLVSDLLRRGICETLAILGVEFRAGSMGSCDSIRADRVVRRILGNATWLTWSTLGSYLSLLAEAAPSEFLRAVQSDLNKDEPELSLVLSDDGDLPMMSSCKHSGLLWALECLAWSPEWLPQVCITLAGLDQIDTGTKWSNRPRNSLLGILLTWYPQTAARAEKRVAVLKSLAKQTPSTTWKILFSLLPSTHSHTGMNHRPVWQPWLAEWTEGTTNRDYWLQIEAAASLIEELVQLDSARWQHVLEEISSIPEESRNRLIAKLGQFPVGNLQEDQRRAFVEQLRKTVRLNRDHADTKWALPSSAVDKLDQAITKFQSEDLCERYAWLFAPWVKLDGFRGEFKAMEEEVDRRRESALSEIINAQGFAGALTLAAIAEAPGRVGYTLAAIGQFSDDSILPGLWNSDLESEQNVASGFARARIFHSGLDWVKSLSLEKWNDKDVALLLSHAQFSSAVWEMAEEFDASVAKEYWSIVTPYGRNDLSISELEFSTSQLIQANRPERAIELLAFVAHDKIEISRHAVTSALRACLEWMTHSNSNLQAETLRTIQDLFGWLQESITYDESESTRQLAQLEWEYLGILDGFAALPSTLIRSLSSNPQFFGDLIGLIFRPEHEEPEKRKLSPVEESRASQAFRLLMNWKRVPGLQDDGTVDEEELSAWVETARGICRESGHLGVADSTIGEMFASWPHEDSAAQWPCEEICDVIDDIKSDDLERGFQIGIFNSRGVTSRGPFDGGDLERREAEKFRNWAESVDVDWPRTAACLRAVAKSYELDAQREDARAAERGQER
ncbi:MAG: helix-turn-helix transcriptional regulator [Planctomycetota bacterium]